MGGARWIRALRRRVCWASRAGWARRAFAGRRAEAEAEADVEVKASAGRADARRSEVGAARLEWGALGFTFRPTSAHVQMRCVVDDVRALVPRESARARGAERGSERDDESGNKVAFVRAAENGKDDQDEEEDEKEDEEDEDEDEEDEEDREDAAGSWCESELEIVRYGEGSGGARLELHAAATALHYGQSCFEGLKAFATRAEHADGGVCVRLFRARASAARLRRSARRLCMPPVPFSVFQRACVAAVQHNLAFVPPPDAPRAANAALYLRPLLIGTGARIGVAPALEYTFLVLATPVGAYYDVPGNATSSDVARSPGARAFLETAFARAARGGLGAAKTGANYAADLLPSERNRSRGFPLTLYADACTSTFVEEFSTSNFVAVTYNSRERNSTSKSGPAAFEPDDPRSMRGARYVTPQSKTVLASITNKSLQSLARRAGMTVERRPIRVTELPHFDEVGAVGTAVVVTPVSSISVREISVEDCANAKQRPESVSVAAEYVASRAVVLTKLKSELIAIQRGETRDDFGWTTCCCAHPHA